MQAAEIVDREGGTEPLERAEQDLDLARAFQRAQRNEECLTPYRDALARLAALGDVPTRGAFSAHLGLAQALTTLSRLDAAEEEARRAREVAADQPGAGKD